MKANSTPPAVCTVFAYSVYSFRSRAEEGKNILDKGTGSRLLSRALEEEWRSLHPSVGALSGSCVLKVDSIETLCFLTHDWAGVYQRALLHWPILAYRQSHLEETFCSVSVTCSNSQGPIVTGGKVRFPVSMISHIKVL